MHWYVNIWLRVRAGRGSRLWPSWYTMENKTVLYYCTCIIRKSTIFNPWLIHYTVLYIQSSSVPIIGHLLIPFHGTSITLNCSRLRRLRWPSHYQMYLAVGPMSPSAMVLTLNTFRQINKTTSSAVDAPSIQHSLYTLVKINHWDLTTSHYTIMQLVS